MLHATPEQLKAPMAAIQIVPKSPRDSDAKVIFLSAMWRHLLSLLLPVEDCWLQLIMYLETAHQQVKNKMEQIRTIFREVKPYG